MRRLIHLKAGRAGKGWNVFLSGTNLNDENYRTDAEFNVLDNAAIASLGRGRSLKLELAWDFD